MTPISRSRTASAKPSETATVLREIGVSPVRSLGQNFLHDRNLSQWIVDQIAPAAGDYVVEIGPGIGALTGPLLRSGARVLALEKDGRLAGFLQKQYPVDGLEVRHGDALNFDVRALFAEASVKVIGNLPYYISSQLLLKFLEYPSPILLGLFMLQKEMANRVAAASGSKDYGALSVLLQRHYQIKLVKRVPATVFIPRPEVDSAVIRVMPRSPGELPFFDDDAFVSLVRLGFSQRRKQLGKLLSDRIPDWPAAAGHIGVNVQARAETLSLDHWIALANYVAPIGLTDPLAPADELFPIVDESDRVIGSAPRAKVHGDNLRHRAVHILVLDPSGEVYLQKRSPLKDRHSGAWDSSAAGHVNAGEDYDEAAARELQEELGIRGRLDRIAKLPASDATGQEFIWLYQTRHEGPMSPNKHEIETVKRFQPAIIAGWIANRPGDFAPGFVECWKTYVERCR